MKHSDWLKKKCSAICFVRSGSSLDFNYQKRSQRPDVLRNSSKDHEKTMDSTARIRPRDQICLSGNLKAGFHLSEFGRAGSTARATKSNDLEIELNIQNKFSGALF